MSTSFLFSFSFYYGLFRITADRMKAVLNRDAPKIEPKGISAVDGEELVPARIAVSTSGDPFAKARKVTPARVGEISDYEQSY